MLAYPRINKSVFIVLWDRGQTGFCEAGRGISQSTPPPPPPPPNPGNYSETLFCNPTHKFMYTFSQKRSVINKKLEKYYGKDNQGTYVPALELLSCDLRL